MTKKIISKKTTKKKSPAKKKPIHQQEISYVISDNSLTVNYSKSDHGRISYFTKSFDKGTTEYDKIKKAIVDGKLHLVPKLAEEVQSSVEAYTKSFKEKFIKFVNGGLTIDGKAVGETLSARIIKYAEEGLPYLDLVNFHRNLMKNPSYTAVQGLFRFLDANHFPLHPSGGFIAYKGVSDDLKDVHTGTFDNSPGKTVKMPRNQVNEDPEQTCSYGLHTASYSYAHDHYVTGAGGKVIEVLVNPKDVVAVPRDYNDAKMRVCEYKVLGLSAGERKEQRVEDNAWIPDDGDDRDDDDLDEESDQPGSQW